MLHVATSSTYENSALLANLSVSRYSTHLELSFLLMDGHAATSGSSLMSRVPRNTHNS